MFRFSNPAYLYLLLLVPVLFLLFLLSNRRQQIRLRELGDPELMAALMPEVSNARWWWHFILQALALTVFIFMMAGPQFGSKVEKVKRRGAELMIAVDVSNSMMSEDILPNRLEKSRQTLSKLIDGMSNDKVGLIVFAGDAYTQLPITADYVSAKMFLHSISTDLVPVQGTAIGAAIHLALRSFGPESEAERGIIILTDGENHEDDAVAAAKEALAQNIHVHVVGVGSPKGGPIPTGRNNDFHHDREGNIVITKLNEEMCQQIAQAGGGIYVRTDNSNAALKVLQQELDKMNKSDMESTVYSEYDEQFGALAWMALFLLFADMLILERRNAKLRKINIFDK